MICDGMKNRHLLRLLFSITLSALTPKHLSPHFSDDFLTHEAPIVSESEVAPIGYSRDDRLQLNSQ